MVMVLAWAFLALLDIPDIPWSGYTADGRNAVVRVEPASPTDSAGLKSADIIQRISGIALQDSRSMAKLGRANIGETRTLGIERDHETLIMDITYAGLRQKSKYTPLFWTHCVAVPETNLTEFPVPASISRC